jgi:CRP/FNR family transcriptional regulator
MLRGGQPKKAPYGFEIIENCLSCPHREDQLFCNLPPAAVQTLSAVTSPAAYPKTAILFVEGQSPRGVFILCGGRVKLSTSSANGQSLIVRIADPGEVLGLPATVTGKPYELTAEVIEPAQAKFIARDDFLAFLRQHGEAALRVAQQLGETYHCAIAEMRTIGLSHSVGEKLARFLLDFSAGHDDGKGEVKVTLTLTHEEIAQMIGASRETVTRLLGQFKRKQLLDIKGSTLIIKNKAGLENVLSS